MVGSVGEMETGMGRMEGLGKKLKEAVQETSWIAGRLGSGDGSSFRFRESGERVSVVALVVEAGGGAVRVVSS